VLQTCTCRAAMNSAPNVVPRPPYVWGQPQPYQCRSLVELRLPFPSLDQENERGKGSTMTASYFEYLKWVVYAVAGVGSWRYLPLCVIRLVAAFTSNDDRHRRCMEVLGLARRDASRIPPYLPASSTAPSQVVAIDGPDS
jgi:hypothetical protein